MVGLKLKSPDENYILNISFMAKRWDFIDDVTYLKLDEKER